MASTGGDGVALAPALTLRDVDQPYGVSFIVTAESAGDFAFVASNWTGTDPSGFAINYDLSESAAVLRGTVFTDRGVYRERETVRLKAVVRDDTPAGHGLLPPGTALDVTVYDSRGREIDRRPIRLNRWSSAEWTWNVPADAALGHYAVRVARPTAAARTERTAGPGEPLPPVFGGFLVAAYRRPDFRVDATLSGDPPIQGRTLRGVVESSTSSAGLSANRPVRWSFARVAVQSVSDAVSERYPSSRYADRVPAEKRRLSAKEHAASRENRGARRRRPRQPRVARGIRGRPRVFVHARRRRRRRLGPAHRQSRVARGAPGLVLRRRLAAAHVRRQRQPAPT